MLCNFLTACNSYSFHFHVSQLHLFLCRQLFVSDFNRRTRLLGVGVEIFPTGFYLY